MKEKEFEKKIEEIQNKIGNDASNLVLDEMGILLADNIATNEELKEKDDKIKSLEKEKESLQKVNSNLFRQVSMADEKDIKEEQEQVPKSKTFNIRDVFDEKGNFKK